MAKLKHGSLCVVSAPPGAGYGRVLKNSQLPFEMVLTPDRAVGAIFGRAPTLDDKGEVRRRAVGVDGRMISSALMMMAAARLEQGLTTLVVDPECLEEHKRQQYADIAHQAGVDFKVLMMDSNERRAINAANWSGTLRSDALDKLERFEPSTALPFEKVDSDGLLEITLPVLNDDRIDIIGDIHGMKEQLMEMLDTLGYRLQQGVPVHPQGRKLLFMGDFVDRGPDSLGVLRLVEQAVREGGHLAIAGNHEDFLLQSFLAMEDSGRLRASTLSSAETIEQLLRIPNEERQRLLDFVKNLPAFYLYKDFVFTHADVEHFDPLISTRHVMLHGEGKSGSQDSDALYQGLKDKGRNRYHLIRGHCQERSRQDSVISLEAGQAFGGDLVALPFDRLRSVMDQRQCSPRDAFEDCQVKVACDYDYNKIKQRNASTLKSMEALVRQGLVEAVKVPTTGLRLYKASSSVYQDNRWGEDFMLKKARGLVLAIDGRIVVHPMDRVAEMGDGARLPKLDHQVVVSDTPRGFMVMVGRDPYGEGLMISTASAFDSTYAQMARQMMEDSGLYDAVNEYLAGDNLTLTFAVRHPDDRRIHLSEDEAYGFSLIGGRENSPKGRIYTEAELDDIASKIEVERAMWEKMTFSKALPLLLEAPEDALMVRRLRGDREGPAHRLPTCAGMTRRFAKLFTGPNIDKLYQDPDTFCQGMHSTLAKAFLKLHKLNRQEHLKSLNGHHRRSLAAQYVEDVYREMMLDHDRANHLDSLKGGYKNDKNPPVRHNRNDSTYEP